MRIRPAWLLLTLALASCEQARRYPASDQNPPKPIPAARAPEPPPPHWSWMRPVEEPHDVPIEFVHASAPDWGSLPKFWNQFPPPQAGTRTAHLGLPPLQAIAAIVLADQFEAIRIKVPLGLPDPRPLIPEANPPTYGKWRLGKKLFFKPVLRSGAETYSCATCHQPDHGFTESRGRTFHGVINTPSHINAVYNRHQFWDGRAGALEEVLVHSLRDEQAEQAGEQDTAEVTHIWGGLVTALAQDNAYRFEFQRVFGIRQPTQDAIAKALATYMRTILSGDSLYDRAEEERRRVKAATLASEHFLAHIDQAALKSLGDGKLGKEEAARKLALGYRLFHGKANCSGCHRGPLFTDHHFHNIGLDSKDSLPPLDKPTGRFAVVPIGLKEARLIGAYRTPGLRALPRTEPYFHDGKRRSLTDVVRFYDREVLPTPYLASALLAGGREQRLGLTDEEIEALVLFLQALDGTPVDPVVSAPMK